MTTPFTPSDTANIRGRVIDTALFALVVVAGLIGLIYVAWTVPSLVALIAVWLGSVLFVAIAMAMALALQSARGVTYHHGARMGRGFVLCLCAGWTNAIAAFSPALYVVVVIAVIALVCARPRQRRRTVQRGLEASGDS